MMIANSKKSSIPEFAKSSVWTFPTRTGITGIMFELFTEYPYPIRYTITKHEKKTKSGFIWTNQVDCSWLFIQHCVGTYDPVTGNIVASLVPGSTVTGSIPENRKFNIDPISSDMYRWSIEISDVSATGSKYSDSGTYTSQMYESPEPISQISLFANHSYNGGNITYSIKPDGAEPTPIQPMEEQYADSNIPKILYVNSSTTEEDRRNGKWGDGAYIDTGKGMNRFQVVINIVRGASESVTPVIDGYVVKVKFADKGGDINAS
jgi:hypothetical protein